MITLHTLNITISFFMLNIFTVASYSMNMTLIHNDENICTTQHVTYFQKSFLFTHYLLSNIFITTYIITCLCMEYEIVCWYVGRIVFRWHNLCPVTKRGGDNESNIHMIIKKFNDDKIKNNINNIEIMTVVD